MNLRQLRNFIAVVDHGGVVQAAAALRAPASTVSQSLRALERDLGVLLFHRISRELVLTSPGQLLATQARATIQAAAVAETAVSGATDDAERTLNIGAHDTLASGPLAGLVGQLRAAHPTARVRILSMPEDGRPETMVREKGCELVLCTLPTELAPDLVVRPAGTQEFWLVAPPGLVGLPDGPLHLDQLPDLPLVTMPRAHALVAEFSERLRAGQGARAIAVVDHREAHLELVLGGLGIAFLDREVVANAAIRGAQVRPITPPMTMEYGFVYDPEMLGPLALALVELGMSPDRG